MNAQPSFPQEPSFLPLFLVLLCQKEKVQKHTSYYNIMIDFSHSITVHIQFANRFLQGLSCCPRCCRLAAPQLHFSNHCNNLFSVSPCPNSKKISETAAIVCVLKRKSDHFIALNDFNDFSLPKHTMEKRVSSINGAENKFNFLIHMKSRPLVI